MKQSECSNAAVPRFRYEGVFFVLLVSAVCQILYSHLGFNPTDEGYLLSGSRRLLDGQIPHRDYVSLRPVGTHLLHAHLLLWAGDRVIWWSRYFAWLEFAATAWFWVRIVEYYFKPFPSPWIRFGAGLTAFMVSVHVFPIMPWNSVDVVFIVSLGIALRLFGLPPRRDWRWIGILLIGTAPLFRQNFILPLPFFLLVLGEGRHWKSWCLVALPSALYGLVLFLFGALPDAILQMASHGSSLPAALLPPPGASGRMFSGVSRESLIAGFLSGAAGFFLSLSGRGVSLRRWGVAILGGGMIFSVGSILLSVTARGWFLFGMLMAAMLFLLRQKSGEWRCALLALLTAWGVSISEGWHYPTLAAGGLFLVLLAMILAFIFHGPFAASGDAAYNLPNLASSGTSVGFVLAAVMVFHWGRTHRIYCELPASQLRHDLSGVFPGARGIYTNQNTHQFLTDLRSAIEWARGHGTARSRIAILPEVAQFWVTSPRPNPLSSDWPIDTELNHPKNRKRILNEIERARGSVIFIVQKHHAEHLAKRLEPYREGTCATRDAVRRDFRKIHETDFFEVYE